MRDRKSLTKLRTPNSVFGLFSHDPIQVEVEATHIVAH
jgi:hypothetical protein